MRIIIRIIPMVLGIHSQRDTKFASDRNAVVVLSQITQLNAPDLIDSCIS